MRHAFVTGFPGFIAKHLLKKLLAADEGLTVTALIEGSQLEAAERALTNAGARSRVKLLAGDVTAMDVGLSGAEFKSLADTVTEIHHLAAVHTLSVDKKTAERVNVHGTGNMLALADAAKKLERFTHFSSAYVSGDRTGVVMEDELEEGQSFKNAYEATKYQAEVLVQRARARIPTTVIRPSAVVGDSRTGEIDRLGSVYHLAMMLIASPVSVPMPLRGEGTAPLNMVPVDYVVDAVAAILSRPDTIGRTFHVVDPNPLPARRVYDLIGERAGKPSRTKTMSPKLTKALLKIPGLDRVAPVQSEAIDYLNHLAFYNSANTNEVLLDSGLTCPPFPSYLDSLMRYVRENF